ncbi:MAG: M23 family metallopeptidase [Firmicutes bacterium]|jgi:murein DD-endopeptidase MepM/ murein hydrolase activator NlpD|nr:M23 family metallopeptidase [Bacillota bacterium]
MRRVKFQLRLGWLTPGTRGFKAAMALVIVAASFSAGFYMAVVRGATRGSYPMQVQAGVPSLTLRSSPLESSSNELGGKSEAPASQDGGSSLAAENKTAPVPEEMQLPVRGKVVGEYGWRRDPVYADWRFNPGVEIACPPGSTVRAALSGKVTGIQRGAQVGVAVTIRHAGGLETRYDNLTSAWVREGDEVSQGDPIGEVGPVGSAGGSVLLFQVLSFGEVRDPIGCVGQRF